MDDETFETNVTDLSSWLGKPSKVAKLPQSQVVLSDNDDASESFAQQSDARAAEFEDSGYPRQVSAMSKTRSGRKVGSIEAVGRPSQVRPRQNGVYIDVPEISDPDEYEYLPGHHDVEKILSEYSQNRFLVKLASGERELLSSQQLRSTNHGLSALKAFSSGNMASRSRRILRKPNAARMVNWHNLDISDSDSDSKGPSQRPRRQLKHSSTNMSDSDMDLQSADDDDEEDDEFFEEDVSAERRSRRLINRKRYNFELHHGLIELDSDSDLPRRRGPRRTKKIQQTLTSRRSKRATRSAVSESSNDADATIARRSERTRDRPRYSMRERQEHEISANSETEVGPKVLTVKEHFDSLPENNSFRRRHQQLCETCYAPGDSDQKGVLVFCQGCTCAYHKSCLGSRGSRDHLVTKVAEKHFVLQCRRCLGLAHSKDRMAPDHGICTGCGESGKLSKALRPRLTTRQEQSQREGNGGKDPITIVDFPLDVIENVMFRCSSCMRAWHMHHLPRRQESQQNDEDDEDLDQDALAHRRILSYHRTWTCKDCVEHQSQIDGLVAWRPVDLETYISGCTVDMMEEVRKEYLVKWRAQSHFRCTWMPGAWVWGVAAGSMRTSFSKKEENRLPKMRSEDAIPEDFLRVDIVFDVRYSSVVRNSTRDIDLARIKEVDSAYIKFKGLGYEDTIWERPPGSEDGERWDDFKTAYEEYVARHYVSIPPQTSLRRHLTTVRTQDFEAILMKRTQPSIVTGGQMMDYQMEGLNWLYYQWFISQNAILADEMGLGKTIQIIAFFATLIQDHKCWPFLVVVPNSTCPNWRREIRKWVPSLRVVTYYGSAVARKLAEDYELFPKDENMDRDTKRNNSSRKSPEVKDVKAHIVVTSYEAISDEKTRKKLQRVPWAGLVVDEGQRLKNDKNLVYESLSKIRFPFKVLLTGTPLQNNARELFNLLQFLDPKINASALEAKYDELTKENVSELHELIRPFFLRRTKAQVLTFLPPMAQIIVPVTMSVVQKKIYKSILAKNPQLMKSIFSRDGPVAAKERHNLNNILMQLRKTLCHPFVYSREIEDRTFEIAVSHRNLVEASSKLQLLSILLPKLQERGHRVLIFSQFLDNLDIVEDFLDGLGLQHCRLDGSINSLEKQKRIDEFNAEESPYFAFLLSTRSGGVGINLATADTVIIMDPDFNPHQDIQALSRAHRIGQKKKVLVFQIMTRGSAEEKIMQIGKKKMVLDHVLIQQMDKEDEAGMDLESILRHGAEKLFNDDDTDDIHYDSASVDKLLDRSQAEDTNADEDKSAESQFSFARIWQNDKASFDTGLEDSGTSTPNPTVWDKILKERERAFLEETAARAETLGRGKRKRHTVDYATQDGLDAEILMSPLKAPKLLQHGDMSDTDFNAREYESDDNASEAESEGGHDGDDRGKPKPTNISQPPNGEFPVLHQPTMQAKPFKRVKVPSGLAPHFNGDGPSDYIPLDGLPPNHHCSACDEIHPMGWCRLKIAGVEHCGLCGLAHVGHTRTCPHLNSEGHVRLLIETLKESTESQELVQQAEKYLTGIKADLPQRKMVAERREVEAMILAQMNGDKNGSGSENGARGDLRWAGVQGHEKGQTGMLGEG